MANSSTYTDEYRMETAEGEIEVDAVGGQMSSSIPRPDAHPSKLSGSAKRVESETAPLDSPLSTSH